MTDEELIEALRSIDEDEMFHEPSNSRSVILRAADRLSALSPRVKALEWSDSMVFGTRKWRGSCPFGEFASFSGNDLTEAQIAEKKAAAQADYERRIMSAIEVSASPRVVSDEVDGGWLIHKAGRGWYRPNAQGYTNDTAQAGRYSHEDALSYSHPNGWDGPRDGITIKHESELQSLLTAALSSAGEKDYTAEDALRRAREIALQSEAAPLCMGEIIKVADMALGEKTPLPEWMTSPHPTSADKLEMVAWAYHSNGHLFALSPERTESCSMPLTDHATASRLIAEKEAEQDAWRTACMEAREGCNQRSNTIGSLRRHLEAAEADRDRMKEALTGLLDHIDRNTCVHESVSRGGSIWTICDDCGKKWADDRGGFAPYSDPEPVSRARAALNGGAEK